MNTRALFLLLWVTAMPMIARGEAGLLTADQINDLDRKGFLTPSFQAAAHQLIDAQQNGRDAAAEKTALAATLPDLQKSAASEKVKVEALKKELAKYDHPDENDFADLLNTMKDASAKPEEQMALAQAYVWTYPMSPHQVEAQTDLAQVQKKIADQTQTVKQADAAQEAAQIKLLQRVKAKDLSLEEWRAFLQDKTQTEVTEYLGTPTSSDDDYWTYEGIWTVDPTTKQKSGLVLTFNGGRVQNVAPKPAK